MRLLGVVVAASLVPAAGAQAQLPNPDAGSTRPLLTARGTVVTTGTASDGALHCIAVRGAASICGRPQRSRSAATLIGYRVVRAGGRPRIGPLVVAGLAGPDALRVRVRWQGGSRTLHPRRFGAYGIVLPSRVRQHTVGITVRYRGGDIDAGNFGPRRSMTLVAGSERVEHRLADPRDGHPLGLLTWRTAQRQECAFLGDLLSGRVGSLRGSWFTEYPVDEGGSCSQVDRSPEPLAFSVSTGGGLGSVSGFARADVAAVEIKVGDGPFVPAALGRRRSFARAFATASPVNVVVAAILRDGRRVEKAISPLPLPPGPVAPPRPAP